MSVPPDILLSYIQGRFFEKSGVALPSVDSASFIRLFMLTAGRHIDGIGDDIPVCSVIHQCRLCLKKTCHWGSSFTYDHRALFWMGYLYRMWQRRTGLSSMEIYGLADPEWLCFKARPVVPTEPVAAIREIYRMKGLEAPEGL